MAPEAAPGRANPARGIALIATAVILGLFILRQGTFESVGASGGALDSVQQDDESSDESSQSGGGNNQGQGNGGGGGGNGNEPQQPQVRPPSDLTVQVANTTGVSGAACNWGANVTASGYQTTEPRQASGDARTTSAVVHRQGLAAEGQELAAAAGVSTDAVTVLQGEPPVDIEGVSLMENDVQLLLLLGEDLAAPVDGVDCPE